MPTYKFEINKVKTSVQEVLIHAPNLEKAKQLFSNADQDCILFPYEQDTQPEVFHYQDGDYIEEVASEGLYERGIRYLEEQFDIDHYHFIEYEFVDYIVIAIQKLEEWDTDIGQLWFEEWLSKKFRSALLIELDEPLYWGSFASSRRDAIRELGVKLQIDEVLRTYHLVI